MPILDIKNQFLDLSKLEINTEPAILRIIDCEITNIELLAAKFPRVSYLTIHSTNVIIMNLDYILSYDLNYVNFNKNVLLLLKDEKNNVDKYIDIFKFGLIYLHKTADFTPLQCTYYPKTAKIIFIQDKTILIIKNPRIKDIKTDPELKNYNKIYLYYTSFFDIEDTIFNNLPSELDELHFNNLRYNTLNNLPPCIKKIYFNWNHCMRGYNQNKRKKILKNILDNSKIPFDCEIISDYL